MTFHRVFRDLEIVEQLGSGIPRILKSYGKEAFEIRKIQEVRNALAAYDRFTQWRPEAESDLMEAHRIMMAGLIDEAGFYRRTN